MSPCGYMLKQINLLDYTSCVVPVTFADKEIDKRDATYKPVSPHDKLVWEKCMSTYSGFADGR